MTKTLVHCRDGGAAGGACVCGGGGLTSKNRSFFSELSHVKYSLVLYFQLIWYILKQLFTSVSAKVVDINLAASRFGKYPPLFPSPQ